MFVLATTIQLQYCICKPNRHINIQGYHRYNYSSIIIAYRVLIKSEDHIKIGNDYVIFTAL